MKTIIPGLLALLAIGPQLAAADPHPGETVYRRICFVCHDRGSVLTAAAGAPRLGNVRAWETRRTRGVEGLFTSITTQVPGKFIMPRIDPRTMNYGSRSATCSMLRTRCVNRRSAWRGCKAGRWSPRRQCD